MKRLWGSVAALVLSALVIVGIMPTVQGASVYFTAVNDTLLDLSASTMPAVVGGTVYVPYTVLSVNTTGVNLGVYATYSSVKNSVLVYSNRNQLIFDLQEDQTYDLNGKYYEERAIVRNSTVYLPVARVCSVFSEIDWSLSTTEYGYLVRIRSSAAVLEEAAFIDAASNMMSSYLGRYQQENPSPSVSEAPSASPEPSPGDNGVDNGSDSGSSAGVYLAFTQTEGGTLESVLNVLTARGYQGLFFLTAEQLAQQDDLVRQMIGTGHFVGFRSTAQTGQEVLEELEQAKDLLASIAHCRLTVVLAEGLDKNGMKQVEQEGYVCWQTTTDGRSLEGGAYTQASTLARQLTGGESSKNYLLLDDQAGDVLATLLSVLGQANYQFLAPVAPEL